MRTRYTRMQSLEIRKFFLGFGGCCIKISFAQQRYGERRRRARRWEKGRPAKRNRKMPIDFYYFPPSPPCRSVMLLAKAIGVHLNLKTINVLKGEAMKPSYLKLNPQHTIPTIDDNGFILCESRPIMGYLVSKYAKNDSLYPKDSKKRAKVDQMLYFDHGTLFTNAFKTYIPVMFGKTNTPNEDDVQAMERSCELLNTFLEDSEFVAGDTLTIADFSISTTIRMLQCFSFDIGRYDNVAAWYNRCKEHLDKFGFEEVHAVGTKMFTEMYQENFIPAVNP